MLTERQVQDIRSRFPTMDDGEAVADVLTKNLPPPALEAAGVGSHD